MDLGEGLESALLDQRLRAEKHKANFEALKAQHLTLQDTHARQKEELDVLAESYDRLAGRSQEIIQTLQSERDAKIVECEELRVQVLTPVRMEQLKAQLLEENRLANKRRVEALESEVEALSRECNGLKYNYTFLKSEYENAQTTHRAVIQELKEKHEAELDAYIEERKSLISRSERDIPTDMQRIRQLQRRNNDFQQKIKGLLAENEELRGDKEQAAAAAEQSQQVQCQQTAELRAEIKTLELESSAQIEKVACLQRELSKARQELVSLNHQLSLSHTELENHKRRMGDLEHQHSLEVSELKMKQLDVCRELEEERESCERKIKSLQTQLEAQEKSMESQSTQLTDKERQAEQRVQAAREKEWEKQVSLEREKIELEATVADLQQQLAQLKEECVGEVEALEDRVRELNTTKAGVESEVELLKSQVEDKSRELQCVMAEVKQVAVVNRKYQSLLSERRKLESRVDSLEDSKRVLEEQLGELHTQSKTEREGWSCEKEKLSQDLINERKLWESERDGLLGKLLERETSTQSLEQQLMASKATNKKLQRHYKKQASELERRVEVLRAEQETTRTEKQALESSLSLENQKLQRKLSDVIRRQKEFQFLLNNHPQSMLSSSAQHPSPEHTESTQETTDI